MKAISITSNGSVELKEVPKPEKAAPDHMIIKMEVSGINAGDHAFINGMFPPGSISVSQHNIAGVSGAGTVVEVGPRVPEKYRGRKVTVYRSLKFGDQIIGTWSEYAHLHQLHCALLPDASNMDDYAGSLVNIITPYAFFKQISEEGHKGIISTAGNSATGLAMTGISEVFNFNLISIVQTEADKTELEALGAKNVIALTDIDFKKRLAELALEFRATAVFDGVGGAVLSNIVDIIPFGSSIYCYGYLGGQTPLTMHTSILMKGISVKGFSNFRSQTVQNEQNLQRALNDISGFIKMPHFKTKIGRRFKWNEINEALSFKSTNGSKAVLCLQ